MRLVKSVIFPNTLKRLTSESLDDHVIVVHNRFASPVTCATSDQIYLVISKAPHSMIDVHE